MKDNDIVEVEGEEGGHDKDGDDAPVEEDREGSPEVIMTDGEEMDEPEGNPEQESPKSKNKDGDNAPVEEDGEGSEEVIMTDGEEMAEPAGNPEQGSSKSDDEGKEAEELKTKQGEQEQEISEDEDRETFETKEPTSEPPSKKEEDVPDEKKSAATTPVPNGEDQSEKIYVGVKRGSGPDRCVP